MAKGMLRVVEGDVTDPQFTKEGEMAIIPHCCNNVGVMEAGVALALRNKWPAVYDRYKAMEADSSDGLKNRLGENCNEIVEKNIIVVNMIGQDGTVSADNLTPVKYWALQKCMKGIRVSLMATLHMHLKYRNMTPVIHTCKFGSDLAGGNWDFILEFIREQWLEYGIDVVVYEFVPK